MSADYEVGRAELKEILSSIRRNNDAVSKKLAMANNRIKVSVITVKWLSVYSKFILSMKGVGESVICSFKL